MRLAQHLAVVYARRAALAPRAHVVGIHLAEVINMLAHAVVATHCAQRAVGDALGIGLLCLLLVYGLDGVLVKEPDVEQPGVPATAQHIFKNALLVGHILICHEPGYFCFCVFRIVVCVVITFVKPAPI